MRVGYRHLFGALLCAIVLIAWETGALFGRDLASGQAPTPGYGSQSVTAAAVPWPVWEGLQQTNEINASFTSIGTLGLGFNSGYPFLSFPGWRQVSFETPPGSNAEYLFAGALWIGGIVGSDTLVSAGADGWQWNRELYPPAGPNGKTGPSVTTFSYPTAFSMRATFTDTINSDIGYYQDVMAHRLHKPLHISIANRSHTFSGVNTDKIIMYDLVITNIGEQTIHQGYIGFYFDCDIGIPGENATMIDDLAGYLADDSIAYIIDNDGDFGSTVPVRRAFAFKVLRISEPMSNRSFNWWSGNADSRFDWGPRKRTDTRDFGTGGSGTPEGDANKYHVLSNGETDYDQAMTAWMIANDTTWSTFDSILARTLGDGIDAKFLYSVGPFELAPDSSIRIIYSTFTGADVHVDSLNAKANLGDSLHYNPQQYVANLNFTDVRLSAHSADSLANLLLLPQLPTLGVVAHLFSRDSAMLSWDPWVYPDVTDYNVYLDSIPRTAYQHEGVIPIWYRPQATTFYAQIGREHACPVKLDNPAVAYACCVAHQTDQGIGNLSEPAILKWQVPVPVPKPVDSLVFIHQGESSTIRWHNLAGEPVRNYSIYKFPDTQSVKLKYSRHYSMYRENDPADSVWANDQWYYFYAMSAYASVPAGETTFVDPMPTDGGVYLITATDTAGFESPFSTTVTSYIIDERIDRALLMTNSTFWSVNYVQADTILDFYKRVMAGHAYDVYSLKDTLGQCYQVAPECINWRDLIRYKVIIVDDGLRDLVMRDWYEQPQGGFAKYLLTGGHIIYFGSLANIGSNEFSQTTGPCWYAKSGAFVKGMLGIDSTFFMGLSYYKTYANSPYKDTIVGFTRAASFSSLPSLSYDTARHPFTSYVESAWPSTSPPLISTFIGDSTLEVTHLALTQYPIQSWIEGRPIGVHKKTDRFEVHMFGFHLWYMDESDATNLLQSLLQDIPLDADNNTPPTLPPHVSLSQNYPNPFNGETVIRYALPQAGNIRLEIFNILGQKVRVLLNGSVPAGDHTILWDGVDQTGANVASGIYLYRLTADSQKLHRKMLLLK